MFLIKIQLSNKNDNLTLQDPKEGNSCQHKDSWDHFGNKHELWLVDGYPGTIDQSQLMLVTMAIPETLVPNPP